ncbi:MAG TPA: LuxR family transcriptional regulator, partial [Mycobacterium sp.]|nr:LuxR family transcriptional regulator [Mycobacterium sp.]
GEATLQVLQGHVSLVVGDTAWEGTAGDYVTIPPERHALKALDAAVVILTVALSVKHPE